MMFEIFKNKNLPQLNIQAIRNNIRYIIKHIKDGTDSSGALPGVKYINFQNINLC